MMLDMNVAEGKNYDGQIGHHNPVTITIQIAKLKKTQGHVAMMVVTLGRAMTSWMTTFLLNNQVARGRKA